jgi:hypothetical protein
MSLKSRAIVTVFWMLAFATVPVWIAHDHVGWDVAVYQNAIRSLEAGHDPYADAISLQEAFHRSFALHPKSVTPFSHVYSPITVPLLRLIGAMPIWIAGIAYWLTYALCALCLVWIGIQAADENERRWFLLLAPAALFFPGTLHHDAILSGNVALVLYALVLFGATVGWHRGQWHWCYLAVLVASCFKAPLLSLVVTPVLSARGQWLPAGITAALGGALFAIQSLIWPSLFRRFLEAVELQFSYNRDFGCSPAGLLSNFLFNHGVSYTAAWTLFYLLYAVPTFGLLLYLSRQFLNARLSLEQWLPVLLVGVILLDPRIMQYDVVPVTLPMALIGLRFLARFNPPARAILFLALIFAIANYTAARDPGTWKLVEGILLVVLFAAGCWILLRQSITQSAVNHTDPLD